MQVACTYAQTSPKSADLPVQGMSLSVIERAALQRAQQLAAELKTMKTDTAGLEPPLALEDVTNRGGDQTVRSTAAASGGATSGRKTPAEGETAAAADSASAAAHTAATCQGGSSAAPTASSCAVTGTLAPPPVEPAVPSSMAVAADAEGAADQNRSASAEEAADLQGSASAEAAADAQTSASAEGAAAGAQAATHAAADAVDPADEPAQAQPAALQPVEPQPAATAADAMQEPLGSVAQTTHIQEDTQIRAATAVASQQDTTADYATTQGTVEVTDPASAHASADKAAESVLVVDSAAAAGSVEAGPATAPATAHNAEQPAALAEQHIMPEAAAPKSAGAGSNEQDALSRSQDSPPVMAAQANTQQPDQNTPSAAALGDGLAPEVADAQPAESVMDGMASSAAEAATVAAAAFDSTVAVGAVADQRSDTAPEPADSSSEMPADVAAAGPASSGQHHKDISDAQLPAGETSPNSALSDAAELAEVSPHFQVSTGCVWSSDMAACQLTTSF